MAPASDHHHHEARKRVPKACDRCRLKKVKCDGNMPCPRCKMEDAVCHFGIRRKSVERPVSAGYVDQIETQQKILIKALREMWSRYAPQGLKSQVGKEPSVHSMVRVLEVLTEPADPEPVSTDFHFNEFLADSGTPFGEDYNFNTKSSSPSCSSKASPISRMTPPLVHQESNSTASSRAQSEMEVAQSFMCPTTLGDAAASLNTSSEACRLPNMGQRSTRPMHCPLPPRPINTPVKPTPLGIPQNLTSISYQSSTDSAISMMPLKYETEDLYWPTMDPMNMHTTFATPSVPMDFVAIPPAPIDDSWNCWIEDHPEYAPLDPLAWSQYVPHGQ